MKIHLEVLPKDTKKTLSLLSNSPFIKQFYLAGGTGLALQIGHRISGDLDFFSRENFDESSLIQKMPEMGKFQLEKKSEQTIIGILNNTKLSFLRYKYQALFPFKIIAGVNVADIIDIACMKIDTISSRGTKRDFIDVYFIAKEIMPLKNILNSFEKKYASINYNMIHIRKSLVFFEDAESDPMPQMLKPADWKEIKSFFKNEITSQTR